MSTISFPSIAIDYEDYQIYPADALAGDAYENIGELVKTAAGHASLGSFDISLGFSAKLKNLWLVLHKGDSEKFAIVADLAAEQKINIIDADQLGTIGNLIDVEVDIGITRIVYSKELLSEAPEGPIDNVFGTDAKVPQLTWPAGFSAGLMGDFTLGFDGSEKPFSLHYNLSGGEEDPGEDDPDEDDENQEGSEADAESSKEDGQTVSVQKRTPAFSLDSIDVSFADMELDIALDATVQMGPLTGKIIQFQLGLDFSDVQHPVITPAIKGIGIGYDSPPISIAGALIKEDEVLNGGLAIGLTEWSMTALGSIGQVSLPSGTEIPSLFIFGYLGGELINIEGIVSLNGVAATMGFNRQLKPPSDLSQLGDHLFIQAAASTPENPTTLTELLGEVEQLNEVVPPSLGDFFFGIGLKGELVELISLYLLPVISIDMDLSGPSPQLQDVNLQVYGLGSVGLPVDAPVLQLDVALLGAFSLLHGNVLIGASLTGDSGITIIPDNKMSLSGSAAFYLDKAHNTFVMTVGGYGPKLPQDPNWPTVHPIKLSWKPSDDFNISADFYFALVPNAIALGFSLDADATFDVAVASGGFSAHLGLDAFIQWKPFAFEADLNASFHAYVNTAFSQHNYDIQADVTLWGQKAVATDKDPDPNHLTIGGSAKLHLHVGVPFTVKVDFGAKQVPVPPISWSEFKSQFIPTESTSDTPKLASLRISQGQINVAGIQPDDDLIVIAPGALAMQAEGFLPPSAGIKFMGDAVAESRASEVGIQVVGYTAQVYQNQINPGLEISVVSADEAADGADLSAKFTTTLISRNLPAALWKPASQAGASPTISPNSSSTVSNVPSGLKIAVNGPTEGAQFTFAKSKFEFEVFLAEAVETQEQAEISKGAKASITEAAESMAEHLPKSDLLSALGLPAPPSFGSLHASDLAGTPYLVA